MIYDDDKDWQAECDARALLEAESVVNDSARRSAAIAHLESEAVKNKEAADRLRKTEAPEQKGYTSLGKMKVTNHE